MPTLEVSADRDWLRGTLTAHTSYLFTVTGLTGGASLSVGAADWVGVAADYALSRYPNPFPSGPQTFTLAFTPDTTGPFFLEVVDPDTVGPYAVAVTTYADDFTDSPARAGIVAAGGAPATGTLEVAGDRDWFAAALAANTSYLFTVSGLTSTGAVRVGPADAIAEESGTAVGEMFPSPPATFRATYTPTASGTYFLEVADPFKLGDYSVQVTSYADDFTGGAARPGSVAVGGPAAQGTIEVAGDRDWVGVPLAANTSYVVTVTGNAASAAVGTAAALGPLTEFASGEQQGPPGPAPQTQRVVFTPTASGTHYIQVANPDAPGAYSVSVATYADDFTDSAARAGTVAVGGPAASGVLEVAGDRDWIGVSLAANASYLVTVTGLKGAGSSTVLMGTADALRADLAGPVRATSGGTPGTTTLAFTPEASGTHYIQLEDPGTVGAYSVSVATYADDFTDGPGRAGAVAVGGAPATGRLEVAGDADWFAVSLAANASYRVTVEGLTEGAQVMMAPASVLAGQTAFGLSSVLPLDPATQTLTFTPQVGGAHHIRVSDPSGHTGAYTVSVATYADDFTDSPARPGSFSVAATSAFTGTPGEDALVGSGGADSLIGLAGSDRYLVNDPADAVVELPGEGADSAFVQVSGWTMAPNLEIGRLIGSATLLSGNAGAEQLVANASLASTLEGGGGEDVLWGSPFADTLAGGAGDDTLRGGGGADRMEGGAGNDQYGVLSASATVVELPGEGTDTAWVAASGWTVPADVELGRLLADNAILFGSAGNDTLAAVGLNATLDGGAGNDALWGSAGRDVLVGGAGDDNLRGRGGADTLQGGAGDDRYVVGGATAVVREAPGEGFDTVWVAASGFTLGANIERAHLLADGAVLNGSAGNDVLGTTGLNTTLNGGAGNDALWGSANADSLIGGDGDDQLRGQGGADVLVGGSGDDEYSVFHAGAQVVEAAGGGADTAWAAANGWAMGPNIEYGRLSGAATHLVGSATGENLVANPTAGSTLSGMGGDDILWGSGFADTFAGGAGNDVVYSYGGADRFVFGAPGWGGDVISGYSRAAGAKIDLRGSGVTGFAQLAVASGDDTLLTAPDGSTIYIHNANGFTAADFLF